MNIDISAGIDHYSADELIGWANSGILYCGEVDLSGLVEKLLGGRYSQEELDKACEEAYSDGQLESCDCEVE